MHIWPIIKFKWNFSHWIYYQYLRAYNTLPFIAHLRRSYSSVNCFHTLILRSGRRLHRIDVFAFDGCPTWTWKTSYTRIVMNRISQMNTNIIQRLFFCISPTLLCNTQQQFIPSNRETNEKIKLQKKNDNKNYSRGRKCNRKGHGKLQRFS